MKLDLCGHGTLATAFILFEELNFPGTEILFESRSGVLSVKKIDGKYEMDFPARPPQISSFPVIIREALSIPPKEVWKARDYMLVYDSEEDIKNIKANGALLNQLNIDPGGIIVTAPGNAKDVDFVSRFFTPQASVFEDPVTGSAHCTLIPFWAKRLNKKTLRALQISKRGGELFCQLINDRVKIKGNAVKYMQGIIEL